MDIEKLPVKAAHWLAQIRGNLEIHDIQLSDDCCKALASHRGTLKLVGSCGLSRQGAKALLKHKGQIKAKLKEPKPEVSEILKSHPSLTN
jgi:hypothetical protein